MPLGYFDREAAIWIPYPDGHVIDIVATTDGIAEIDVTGDGLADPPATLDALGIFIQERETLASLYEPGRSFWRISVTHFSPWDCNWPFGLPEDAEPPEFEEESEEEIVDVDCGQGGSVIECSNQVLGEQVNVAGTPFFLSYRSDRTIGRRARTMAKLNFLAQSLPASLARIDVQLVRAGQVNALSLPPELQTVSSSWDGLDPYGRQVQGGAYQSAVRVGFVYPAVLLRGAAFEASFGRAGSSQIIRDRTRQEITLWSEYGRRERIPRPGKREVGLWDARGIGLGGWTLSVHHFYDVESQMLYLGNGEKRTGADVSHLQVEGSSNTIYVDGEGREVVRLGTAAFQRRPGTNGLEQRIGLGSGFSGDGGPDCLARFNNPRCITEGPDGAVYIADQLNNRVRRVSPPVAGICSGIARLTGTITTFAGGGSPSTGNGDGGLAIGAAMFNPVDVAGVQINLYPCL